MNLSNSMKQYALYVFLLPSFSLFGGMSPLQKRVTARKNKQSVIVSEAFQTGIFFINQIGQTVQRLSIAISKNHIKGLPNKEEIKSILYQDAQLINGLVETFASITDPEQQKELISSLIDACNAIIEHLEEGLNSNFKKFKNFDVMSLQAKRQKRTVDVTKLPEELTKMAKKIDAFQQKAEHIGLKWYNHCARQIDNYVVKPWNRWYLTPVLGYSLGTLALGSYLIWLNGAKSQNETIKSIYNFLSFGSSDGVQKESGLFKGFGQSYDINMSGEYFVRGENKNNNPYQERLPGAYSEPSDSDGSGMISLSSSIELVTTQILKGNLPIAAFASSAYYASISETWKNFIWPRIEQRRSAWWNQMRGGAFLNEETPGLTAMAPTVTFDDMTGMDEIKEAFSCIIDYVENPEKFTNSGAKPEIGWLLTGPTRTGKSFSFECLCGEITRRLLKTGKEFKFLKIGIQEIEQYTIDGLIAYAREFGPMILFIDEIDLLGLQRVGDNKLLHKFLTALQSTHTEDPSKVVIVMAATNCPEHLDQALRQYGRFGKEIRFEHPSFRYRKEYIVKELRSMALDIRLFDIDALVSKTDGKSYEDIRAIIRTAMTRAWALNKPLTQELLEQSVDTELYKIIMADRKDLPESETRILSAHFAGKALAMMLLQTYAKLDKVTIKAIMADLKETSVWYSMHAEGDKKEEHKKIIYGHLFTKHSTDTIGLKTLDQLIDEVKVLLAGFVAEELLLGSCSWSCHKEDYAHAYNIIDLIVFEGTDPMQLSKNKRNELRDKTYALRKQYKDEVYALLSENQEMLQALADELRAKGLMTDKQVKAVLDKYTQSTINAAPAA